MQTEPLGFKGTSGIWTIDKDGIYSADLPDYGNIIADAPTSWEESMKLWDSNSKLMAASKKMAIALQQICELPQTIGHAYEIQSIAKEALKEAGL